MCLRGHLQMSFAGVEPLCGAEAECPHPVLRPLCRGFVLLVGFDVEDVLRQPLLRRQQWLPPVPLRRNPPSEVFSSTARATRGPAVC